MMSKRGSTPLGVPPIIVYSSPESGQRIYKSYYGDAMTHPTLPLTGYDNDVSHIAHRYKQDVFDHYCLRHFSLERGYPSYK